MAGLINSTVPNVYEFIGEFSIWPGEANFDLAKQVVTRKWYWPNTGVPATASDLKNFMKMVLGTTSVGVSVDQPGRLTRSLPLMDPVFTDLPTRSVRGPIGRGTITRMPAELAIGGAFTYPGWTLYSDYEFDVTCENSPYPTLSDAFIPPLEVHWVDSKSNNQGTIYYPEWRRYTDFTIKPAGNWIAQQNLTAFFETRAGLEPGIPARPAQFTGQARMHIPDGLVIFRWDGIPARYVTSNNSYLEKFRGMINQHDWSGPLEMTQAAGQAPSYPAGTLLYDGYDIIRKYRPPFPQLWAGAAPDWSLLVDVDIRFLYTKRVTTDPPDNVGNWIKAGWNALPYFPYRQFFSCYNRDTTSGTHSPMFYSFPIELLWTDPDAPGAYQGTG